ncbi:MAG: hypothetical protein CMD16_05015 [Flavobacteriales bacterium]|nr:hypothetical protein [Flavobacteriales bacterium]
MHQVLILNEGYFDFTTNQIIVPPTIGSYDPLTQVYTSIDTLSGSRFASDMIIDGDYIYIAADNMLYKYDKYTMAAINNQQVDGIRNLAIWNDKIIVTRGDYDNTTFMPVLFNSYLQIFNTSDLSFYMQFDTISGPKWSTQNMIVNNDMLYVAVNNAYEWGNEKGIVGVVDMSTMYYTGEIDLGPDAKNPDNMLFDGTNIYTVNNKDWSGASISKLDLATSTPTTVNMSMVSTGCGTSCLRDNKVVYQISGDTDLYEWDPATMPISGIPIGFAQNFYTLQMDNINNYLYTSSTDFFSYGSVEIYDSANVMIESFNCGISPGKIVFDIRNNITSIDESIVLDSEKNTILYDLSGRVILNEKDLPSGVYIKNNQKVYISKSDY